MQRTCSGLWRVRKARLTGKLAPGAEETVELVRLAGPVAVRCFEARRCIEVECVVPNRDLEDDVVRRDARLHAAICDGISLPEQGFEALDAV